jgi:UDP-N-acetyl-D-mannosaminuronic acid dehydrogenase
VPDPQLLPLEEVLRQSDVLIIGAPHDLYRTIDYCDRTVIDIWGITGAGISV